MAGEFGIPYRPPCGGWPAQQRWYIPSHFINNHAAVRRWLNVTRVDDYHVSADPNGIAPYPRPDTQFSWPACTGTSYPDVPECVPPPDAPPCGPWRPRGHKQAPDGVKDCAPADASHYSKDHNCYELSDPAQYQNLAVCRKAGFKNVQAFKAWHGIRGPASPFLNTAKTMDATCSNVTPGDGPCAVHDDVKYRTVSGTASVAYNEYYFGGATSGAASFSSTVDRYSGVVTGWRAGMGSGDGARDAQSWLTTLAMFTKANIIGWYCDKFANVYAPLGLTVDPPWKTMSWTEVPGSSVSVTFTRSDDTSIPTSTCWISGENSMTLNLETGHFTENTSYRYFDATNEGFVTTSEEAYVTATSFHYSFNKTVHDFTSMAFMEAYYGPDVWDVDIEVDTTYGDPYTSADVWTDVKGLLNSFRLDDDTLYPWRHDEYCTIAPLVTYDETGPTKPILVPEVGVYVDPNAQFFSGEVIGQPSAAGTEPHFDFNHRTWRCCVGTMGYNVFYPYSHGANAGALAGDITDAVVPNTATQWTENYGSGEMSNGVLGDAPGILYHGDMRAGAWVIHMHGRGIYAQKWAEVLLSWPSVNFARPCGVDRGELDQATSECVNQVVDGTVILESNVDINTGDYCLYNGNIYQVTKVADGEYALGAVKCAAPAWTNWSRGDQPLPTNKLCKLRWWQSGRAICDRAKVGWVSNESPIMVKFDEDQALITGDSIDLSGITGVTAANGTWLVTVIDPKTVTLNDSAGNLPPLFVAPPAPAGLLVVGNIDINNRPLVENDGEISTVFSTSIEEDEVFVLIPRVDATTRTVLSPAEAIGRYTSTGEHLGKFDTQAHCEAYAEQLHLQQLATYSQTDAWARSTGAPDSKWHDDNSKREYIVRSWAPNGILSEAQDCMAAVPCCPSVMAYLPPGAPEDGWTNAKTYGIQRPAPNECESQVWVGDFLQAVVDPFWRTPPAPCAEVVDPEGEPAPAPRWAMDDMTCRGDETEPYGEGTREVKYYPHAPLVEPLLAPPEGAPALAAGVTLHTPSGLPVTSSSIYANNVPTPKPIPGVWTPWIRLQNTIQECRFYQWYEKWRRCC